MTNSKKLKIILAAVFGIALEMLWLPCEWFNLTNKLHPFPFYQVVNQDGSTGLDIAIFLSELGVKLGNVVFACILVVMARLYFDLKVVFGGLISFRCMELLLFFLCYNTWNYSLVYLGTLVFSILYWYHLQHGLMSVKPFTNWYYNGWKTAHYNYLDKKEEVKIVSDVKYYGRAIREPRPSKQHLIEALN